MILMISIFIKVLGMDLLPPQKFAVRQWRFGRKRRRSGTEGADSEGNEISFNNSNSNLLLVNANSCKLFYHIYQAIQKSLRKMPKTVVWKLHQVNQLQPNHKLQTVTKSDLILLSTHHREAFVYNFKQLIGF